MKRTVLSAALIACLLGLALTITGCDLIARKATEGAISGATGGKVDVDGDKVTIKGEDGTESTISNETKIPDGFPTEVPLRDDGSVKAAITSQVNNGTNYMLNIRFKVPQTELLEWYKTELEKGGWKIISTVSTGDGGMIGAEKDNLTLNVVTGADSSEGFTSVLTMQVGPKSN
jgi:hypothetical protein